MIPGPKSVVAAPTIISVTVAPPMLTVSVPIGPLAPSSPTSYEMLNCAPSIAFQVLLWLGSFDDVSVSGSTEYTDDFYIDTVFAQVGALELVGKKRANNPPKALFR